jgi:hypothetical protein
MGMPKFVVGKSSGWVRAEVLAERMDRYFYHFEVTAARPERWIVHDDPHTFECYWMPLSPRPELDHESQVWNDEYYDKLLASLDEMERS